MSTSFLPLLNDKDKDNQFYLLIKGTTLYRADDNKIHTSSYKPRFFGISQKGVQSYGKIVYKFTTKKDLKLLAIDKNIVNVFQQSPENIKNIFRRQYGYNESNQDRIRDSISKKDNELVDYICKNFPQYDGYAADLMTKADGFDGLFPQEIVICDPNNVSSPELITNISKEQIKSANKDAMLLELNKSEKASRKKKKKSYMSSPDNQMSIYGNDENTNTNLFSNKNNMLNFESPPTSPIKKINFGFNYPDSTPVKKMNFTDEEMVMGGRKKRRTKRKKRSTNKKSKRKNKKKNTKRRISKKKNYRKKK